VNSLLMGNTYWNSSVSDRVECYYINVLKKCILEESVVLMESHYIFIKNIFNFNLDLTCVLLFAACIDGNLLRDK